MRIINRFYDYGYDYEGADWYHVLLHTRSVLHTHSVLMAIFPGEPGLTGCPLNSPSPFIPGLRILLGQA